MGQKVLFHKEEAEKLSTQPSLIRKPQPFSQDETICEWEGEHTSTQSSLATSAHSLLLLHSFWGRVLPFAHLFLFIPQIPVFFLASKIFSQKKTSSFSARTTILLSSIITSMRQLTFPSDTTWQKSTCLTPSLTSSTTTSTMQQVREPDAEHRSCWFARWLFWMKQGSQGLCPYNEVLNGITFSPTYSEMSISGQLPASTITSSLWLSF